MAKKSGDSAREWRVNSDRFAKWEMELVEAGGPDRAGGAAELVARSGRGPVRTEGKRGRKNV